MRHKKFFGIPLLVIIPVLVLLLIGGSVIAAWMVQKDIPASIVIGGFGMEAYQDAACTTVLTQLTFPSVGVNETSSVTFYVKNTGNEAWGVFGTCAWTGPNEGFEGLTVNGNPVNILPLTTLMWEGGIDPGMVKTIELTARTQPAAPLQQHTFTLYVIGKDSP